MPDWLGTALWGGCFLSGGWFLFYLFWTPPGQSFPRADSFVNLLFMFAVGAAIAFVGQYVPWLWSWFWPIEAGFPLYIGLTSGGAAGLHQLYRMTSGSHTERNRLMSNQDGSVYALIPTVVGVFFLWGLPPMAFTSFVMWSIEKIF